MDILEKFLNWITVRLNLGNIVLGSNRYYLIKIYITTIVVLISITFIIVILFVSKVWLHNFLQQETSLLSKWYLENTKTNLEYFIKLKLSALKFITSEYTVDQLEKDETLHKCFLDFKREFGDIVDMGIINANGIMVNYVGPYKSKGKNYSEQEWFHQVIVRDVYVSEVFMGFRKIPHFAIALKILAPGDRDFFVIRATVDTNTLMQFIINMTLKEGDDVFLVNRDGILQTASKYFGNVLVRFKDKIPDLKNGSIILENKQIDKKDVIIGYTHLANSPWVLVSIIQPKVDVAIARFFLRELLLTFVISVFLILGFMILISHILVSWIKIAHKERENAMMEIEHSSKLASIGRLAAGVAHEINNPLSIINQNAGLLLDIIELNKNSPGMDSESSTANMNQFEQIGQAISNAVSRCNSITYRLLGFARRMDVENEIINLKDTITEVLSFLEKEFLYKNVTVSESYDTNLPMVTTDKGQLQQVVLNLVNNALDAVDNGGLIEIKVFYAIEGDIVEISIEDNGHGIPEESLRHVFEPFFTTKERGKGTGLGLSICHGIVKKLGGSINVESIMDKGSRFMVKLPVKKDGIMKEF